MFSLEDILNIAVQLEINGGRIYRQAAEKSSRASLRSFMSWMADQEADHAAWFEQLKAGAAGGAGDPDLARMGKALLEDVVGGHGFSLGDQDLSRVENMKELIRVSIEFENDTVLFYEMLAAFIGDRPGLALLRKIIDEERRHVLMLQELLGN